MSFKSDHDYLRPPDLPELDLPDELGGRLEDLVVEGLEDPIFDLPLLEGCSDPQLELLLLLLFEL